MLVSYYSTNILMLEPSGHEVLCQCSYLELQSSQNQLDALVLLQLRHTGAYVDSGLDVEYHNSGSRKADTNLNSLLSS